MQVKFLLPLIGFVIYKQASSQSYLPEKNNSKFKVQPVIKPQAYAFNLKDVRLIDNSPFKHAMEIDGGYMLSLSADRLLNRFYKNSGLQPKDSAYGGWESEGLSGHTLGHYLSACSMMYASTGDARFKQRVDYIVDELVKCQVARKTGYIGAIPKEDSIFYKVQKGDIKTGGFDLNGGWSPWYTVHKVMAGLVDAYLYCDNSKALDAVIKMADWTGMIVDPLTDEQRQKMLKCEYGGMNDVLANIYAITGNKKYLDLSYKFYDDFVMQPLAEGRPDPLAGKHSNTNIPKAIGSARQYELTASKSDETIANRAWNILVNDHSYVTGGNGNYEYLGQPDKLNDALSDNTAESCCIYNMLKLTGHLFSWQPNAELMNYYERALYNDILASQNPNNAMMLYFEPLRMGAKKEFSDSTNTFTCCVGSGMENHAKYTEDIYFEGADGSLYINLFIPSQLNWKDKNVVITQHTAYPENGTTSIMFSTKKSIAFPVKIRQPWWAKNDAVIKVNDKIYKAEKDANGFLVVNKKWNGNDKIDIAFEMSLYTESMPDNNNRVALLYGPLVLAGNLGDTMPDPVYGTPVLLTDNHNVSDWVVKDANTPLTFHTRNTGKPFDVTLTPFYKNIDNHYSVYWDYFTNADWTARQAEYEAEKKRQQQIEAQTIDNFRIGEMQPERDHNLKSSEQSYVDQAYGRSGREVRKDGFFSFDMKVDAGKPTALLFSYIGDDKNRSFDILVDGVKIASVELTGKTTGKFYDEEYTIPPELVKDKSTINVKVQSTNGKTAGRVFGVRTIRK
ncbi:MAG TPA: beta-L-arabinofuranosidase domain-containing protein [Parafilimonas sp.]|nr:beta-L-arabinofuranosidase domain-containing protein [Parafilimonas sp.]